MRIKTKQILKEKKLEENKKSKVKPRNQKENK